MVVEGFSKSEKVVVKMSRRRCWRNIGMMVAGARDDEGVKSGFWEFFVPSEALEVANGFFGPFSVPLLGAMGVRMNIGNTGNFLAALGLQI